MNEDVKTSKLIFKQLLTVKKLDEEIEEERFTGLSSQLERLITRFRDYKSAFNGNEELREKCERLYSELIKASSFLMNYYLEKLGKKVLNRKTIVSLIDALDINNINPEALAELSKILANVDFIEQNLEENFYHSSRKIILASKIQFLGMSLRLFIRNFNDLQAISTEKAQKKFNHKEFFSKTINEFSNALKLEIHETQPRKQEGSKEKIPLKDSPSNGEPPQNNEDFCKEDLLDSLERYIQRNKGLFDIESQSQEFEKEKKSFLEHERLFASLLKELVTAGKAGFDSNSSKYEELENHIRKLKEFKKFFCNVINVHQEYYKYIKEVEKYVNSIDNWLRVFQTLTGSLKALFKLKSLPKSLDWFNPETLKTLKGLAQELFVLSARAGKLVNNEAVNLLNKQAMAVIEEAIEFLNKIYFNLAGFLEFDIVLREQQYRLVFQAEFMEAVELMLRFEEQFIGFLEQLDKVRGKEIKAIIGIDKQVEAFQLDYMEKVQEYFAGFNLKTLRRVVGSSKSFNDEGFNVLMKDLLMMAKIVPSEGENGTKVLPVLNELYKKILELCEKIQGVKQVFELLRRLDSPEKFATPAENKKLVSTVGLDQLRLKFDEMGFEDWLEFLLDVKLFLEGFMLSYDAKKPGKAREKVGDLKKMGKMTSSGSQKEFVKALEGFIQKIVN